MNPKQQAEHILNTTFDIANTRNHIAIRASNCKALALYTVQLIINSNPHSNPLNSPVTSTMPYWMEVKAEIEKL